MKQYAVAEGPQLSHAGGPTKQRSPTATAWRSCPSLVILDKEGNVMAYLVGVVDEAR